MKSIHFRFLLVGVLISNLCYSQSVFQEKTKWVIWYNSDGILSFPSHYRVYENYIDSIVNGTEFCHFKVYVGSNYTIEKFTIKGKKVYVDEKNYSVKNPVYDFTLKKGDILSGHKIDSVSSVRINGRNLIVQYLSDDLIFVEGFGCLSKGFVHFDDFNSPGWSYHAYTSVRTCINDSAFKYENSLDTLGIKFIETPCMDSTMQKLVEISKQIKRGKIMIYPNPVSERLIIDNFKGEVEIYNLQGLLQHKEVIDDQEFIDVSHLVKGIYYVRLDTGKEVRIEKFVKY
jgi:hypothetical protein